MFNISQFKAALRYGGARSTHFQVQITNPANPVADLQLPLMAFASQAPSWTVASLPVYHAGRPINVAGNRQFDDWSINIYNDEDFKIRDAMEQWSNQINAVEQNIRLFATSEPALYKSSADVIQFSQTGVQLRSYKIVGIFPKQIGPLELSWDNEAVQTFPVTFAVDYIYVDSSITGDLAGGV